jgi:hypothetical protein
LTGRRWFLPEPLDIVGLLRGQLAITIGGLQAFTEWAGGSPTAAEAVREAETKGDVAKRKVLVELRAALVSPMEPEDAFTISQLTDAVLNRARDVVNESEAMKTAPDETVAAMGRLLTKALLCLDRAIENVQSDEGAATAAADEAIHTVRELERTYYRGMADSLEDPDQRARIARREIYRRCFDIGELLVADAERVTYAIVKES